MFPVLLIYNLVALFPLAKCFSLYMFHFIHNITIDAYYDEKKTNKSMEFCNYS